MTTFRDLTMTYQELIDNFSYNPSTGELVRITRANSNGSIDAYGYLIIKFKGRQYKAHRLAWMYVTGNLPNDNIDHINGNKLDNRIDNLRDVAQCINCRNATIQNNSETGVKGVYIDRTNGLKKCFTTKIFGKTHRFYTIKEAKEFREMKLKEAGYGERHF